MGRYQQNTVRLNQAERELLQKQTMNGQWTAREILRAKILLLADEDNPEGRHSDDAICNILGCSITAVAYRRKRFVDTQSVEDTIFDKPRSGRPTIVDGAVEAHLTKIACSETPKGKARWSLNLIRNKVITLEVVDDISVSTIGRVLKKKS